MRCLVCSRDNILYPIIDRYSGQVVCPYCTTGSLVMSEGESEETFAERLRFAESQNWRYRVMQTKMRVVEQEKHHLTGDIAILYTENEGERFQTIFIPTVQLEETLDRFRNEGTLRYPFYDGSPAKPYKDIPVASLLVAELGRYLCRFPDVEQCALPKSDDDKDKSSEDTEPMV